CDVDSSKRPAHVATSTIQELTTAGGTSSAAGGGTRVSACTLSDDGLTVTVAFTAALDEPSVQDDAFAVALYSAGWSAQAFTSTLSDPQTVALTLGSAVTLGDDDVLRVIASGTGPHPLLDTSLATLAGGHDSVTMIRKGN